MIFSKKFLTISAICLSMFISYGVSADTIDSVFFRDFDDDSYFVTVPTYAGNYLGLAIGIVPSICIAGGFQFANCTPATVTESGRVTLAIFVKPIGLLFGLPFKLTKVILWTAPKYVFNGILEYKELPIEIDGDSGVPAQVDEYNESE
ncbi:MAG: hypothetical protein KOO69_04535 [Victivallales bacterium]|nr:hypothetical protein [Victivallales bacterium]